MLRKILLAISLLSGAAAYGNISLSPYYLELGDTAGRTGQVRFTNNSQSEKTYNITMVNFKQSSDGRYSEISEPIAGNPFAGPYLEWSPHQATLQPGQSQVVRVRRRGMAAAPAGEYVSHMLIRELPGPSDVYGTSDGKKGGLVINLKPLYGVSIPVMIVHGELNSSAQIDNARVIKRDGRPVAVVTISRAGSRSFFGSVVVKDGRREIGKISNFRIFMTTPSRVLDIPLTQMPAGDASVTLIDESTNETLETKSI